MTSARCATHRECRGGREMRGFGIAKIFQRVQHPPRRLLQCNRISPTGFPQRDVVTRWSSPGQMVREREIRASCVESSSTTRSKSREQAGPYSGNSCPTRRSAIPARRWRDAQNWIWCRTRSTKPRGRWKRSIWKYKQLRTKRS